MEVVHKNYKNYKKMTEEKYNRWKKELKDLPREDLYKLLIKLLEEIK